MIGYGTNLWSADGNYQWSADGFTGWTADGYEPTDLQTATADLATFGVNVGPLTYQYDPLVPLGYVITGYVPFMSVAYAGKYIPLVISNGPAPGSITLTVPDVTGLFYYDAQLKLLQAGLCIGQPVWQLATHVGNEYVISQSIPGGTVVPNQTQVDIVVANYAIVDSMGVTVPAGWPYISGTFTGTVSLYIELESGLGSIELESLAGQIVFEGST